MPAHIPYYDNNNNAIINNKNHMIDRSYLNRVLLRKGNTYQHDLQGYESCCTVATGTCTIKTSTETYTAVGKRTKLFKGKPDSVYIPLGDSATITAESDAVEILIAAGKATKQYKSFRIHPEEVDTVQYGSDDTKTHRKIYHILEQKQEGMVDKLLLSELFTVGAGGWSGFPPHKHHVDREGIESDHEEIYLFKFNPSHGFGTQFAYVNDDDFGPVYHIKNNSVIVLDKKLIYNVHCCGGNKPNSPTCWPDESTLRDYFPLEGDLPAKEWTAAIQSTGYNGYVSRELLGPICWENSHSYNAKKMLTILKTLFK